MPVGTLEQTDPPDDHRLSDVDGWGRSEHMRSIVRRLYDPMYRYWFRVEWEGLEKIPTEGGALLIANHAGAIPSDAPAIMHGIETELGRPVYGLADYFFRTMPVVGTLWSRTGGVPAHPDNAYRLLHDERQLALVFPEGTKATSKTYTRPLPAAPVRPRRVRRDRHAGRRPDDPDRGRRRRGVDADRLPGPERWPAAQAPLLPGDRQHALLLGPLGYVTYFPAKFKTARPRPDHLRRRARVSGAVLEEPGDGRGGEHPCEPAGSTLRHAPRAAQRLVRLISMGRRVLITGLDSFWGGRMAQALESEPDVEMILGLGTDDPKVPLERTEFVRSDQKYSILNRIVRATQVDTIVHTFLEINSISVSSTAPPRDQRDRNDEPARRRRHLRGPRSARW